MERSSIIGHRSHGRVIVIGLMFLVRICTSTVEINLELRFDAVALGRAVCNVGIGSLVCELSTTVVPSVCVRQTGSEAGLR